MDLDISALERSIARLEEGLAIYRADPGQALIRDGLVQRFEFTYEIAHKMLRRYLADNAVAPDMIRTMNFADIIRMGNESGLLPGDWPRWRGYRDMRARTSHSHDEAIATEVVAGIPDFQKEVLYPRDQLLHRQAG